MTTKHTPGPWHIGMRPGPIVYGPQGEQVADLRADLLPPGENRANARLIAAAPKVLAAAKAILPLLSYHGQKGCDAGCEDCAAIDALEAILSEVTCHE